MGLICVAIVPARWASSRFPGKPLAPLRGKPMIQHVVERVRQAPAIGRVLVATDDDRVAAAVRGFGGEVAMTGEARTGTDRVCQAARALAADVVLNVQGDEPLIEPACLSALLAAFDDPAVEMATLKRPLAPEEAANPNVVKVVCDRFGDALYFSRAPLPYPRHAPAIGWAHVGVYAYRKAFLETIAALPSTPLEHAEGLEQLRVLESGFSIRVVETSYQSVGVDTPEDLARAEKMLAGLG